MDDLVSSLQLVTQVLLATDADWLFEEVSAALTAPGTDLARIRDGRDLGSVAAQMQPDLVLIDLQIGSKGGIASCIDLRHDIAMGRAEPAKILMLLDRDADRWLARQADADGWLVKPLDAFRLRKAAKVVLAGGTSFEGEEAEPALVNAETDRTAETDASTD